MDKTDSQEPTQAFSYPPLTDWANEPNVTDLKADLLQAQNHHDAHVTDVNRWLDKL